ASLAGCFAGAGADWSGAASGWGDDPRKFSTSPFVSLPPGPVAGTCEASTRSSATSLRTAGESGWVALASGFAELGVAEGGGLSGALRGISAAGFAGGSFGGAGASFSFAAGFVGGSFGAGGACSLSFFAGAVGSAGSMVATVAP